MWRGSIAGPEVEFAHVLDEGARSRGHRVASIYLLGFGAARSRLTRELTPVSGGPPLGDVRAVQPLPAQEGAHLAGALEGVRLA